MPILGANAYSRIKATARNLKLELESVKRNREGSSQGARRRQTLSPRALRSKAPVSPKRPKSLNSLESRQKSLPPQYAELQTRRAAAINIPNAARTSSNRFSLLPPRGLNVYVILLSLSVVALLALVPAMYVYRTSNMQTMKSAVAHVGQIRHETGAMDVKNVRFTAAVAVDVATQQ